MHIVLKNKSSLHLHGDDTTVTSDGVQKIQQRLTSLEKERPMNTDTAKFTYQVHHKRKHHSTFHSFEAHLITWMEPFLRVVSYSTT